MAVEQPNAPAAGEPAGDRLEVPAPTAWPMVMALGLALLATGLVTTLVLSALGAVLAVVGLGGWIRQLFPGIGSVQEEFVPPEKRPRAVEEHRGAVETLRVGMPGHRMRVPEKIHPYSAGAWGGIYGGIAMTIPALVYGIVSRHGIWYPINLMIGMVVPLPQTPEGTLDIPALESFHFSWFLLGLFIHAVTSVGLGLMYGVILPMLPGRPIFWGGVVAPLLWTGAVYGFMGVLNPALAENIDWPSFIIAQFVYGIVVGLVVMRSEKVYAADLFESRRGRRPPEPPPSPTSGGGNP